MEEHKHTEHHHTEHKEHEHAHKEHKPEHIEHKKVQIKKKDVWKIISLVLGILFIVSLFTQGFSGKKSGASVDKQKAANDAIQYINSYLLGGQGTATLKDVTEQDNLYVIKMNINGRDYDSYLTRDGKYLFPQGIDITEKPAIQETPETIPEIDMKALIDDDEIKGDPNAPITIVEFSDFECPFCVRFYQQTLSEIEKEYIDTGKVKFVYRDFALSIHPNAQKAAEAAECAGEQGKFWEMHNKLFEDGVKGGVESFKQFAQNLGLNTVNFNDCLDSGKMASEVAKDMQDGSAVGITGTPAFIINGQTISGAQPFANFKQVIDAELAK